MQSHTPASLTALARRTAWDQRSPEWRRALAIIYEDGPAGVIRAALRETLEGEVDDPEQMARVVNYALEEECEAWWEDRAYRSTFRRDRHREIDFSEFKDRDEFELE